MNNTTTDTTLKDQLITDYSDEIVNAFLECFSEDDLEYLEESYQGEWDSDEEFVEDLLEDTGDIPEDLPAYVHIDWQWTAREIMHDYRSHDGYYFRHF